MNRATAREHGELWRLARDCGVKPGFTGAAIPSGDDAERRRRASPEAVMAVLRSLGITIDRPEEAREMRRNIEAARRQRIIEPIIVNWQGETAAATLRLNESQQSQLIECAVTCEDGTQRSWTSAPDERKVQQTETVEGARAAIFGIALPGNLPAGYHRLFVTIGGHEHAAKLIVAPPRAMPMRDDRAWGAFIPLYALRRQHEAGVGDLDDLRQLLEWTHQRGGSLIGTLPLLAAFLDRPCDPSPYTPVSRLFFNEVYLNLTAVGHRVSALSSPGADTQHDAEAHLRQQPDEYVDFAHMMAVKRSEIERALAAADRSMLRAELEREAVADPYLAEYARFRAVVERHGPDSGNWPDGLHQRIRNGDLADGDANQRVIEYHMFVQSELRRQLHRIAAVDRAPGRGLYLDLPVGVHSHGYDAWRFSECFADGASCGAPPDDLYIGGQNWGFAPMHPQRSREAGHAWFIEAIRRHLQFAGLLRIDHVMWPHRMYWVPEGFPATDGVYVRNPSPEEFYAILSIESHRHAAAIVGENLGTVPEIVNRTMRRRGIYSLAVGQFMLTPNQERPLSDLPRDAVASLNTHDTPTFAAYWAGSDIDQCLETGLLDESAAEKQREQRAAVRAAVTAYLQTRDPALAADEPGTIAARLLEVLGEGEAAVVLATLEDFWGEARPQNVPGTMSDRNWSRRAALTMEQFMDHAVVLDGLARLDRARQMPDSSGPG